jgi:hypothetical protein
MDSPSPAATKYTVFFSASNKDYEWRDRIKAALGSYPPGATWDLEMWDDSNILPGDSWRTEIEAAINRASVAVIILSPDYLESRSALFELSRLLHQSRTSNFRLFPVVVRACAWESVPELSEIQIWRMGRAIEALSGEAQEKELTEIAQAVFRSLEELGGSVRATTDPKGGQSKTEPELSSSERTDEPGSTELVSFSTDADSVVSKARELMDDSQRNLVTSSCLIMAIAYEPDLPDASRQFLRTAIDHATGYDAALKGFLADGTRISEKGSVFAGPSLGMVNPDVRYLLAEAENISRRVSSSASPIEPRHLLAALLTTSRVDVGQGASRRMDKLGLDRNQLRKDFLAFVEEHFAFLDNLGAWRAILAPAEESAKSARVVPSGSVRFSDETLQALAEALRLMKESGRVRLSVSCLLFGIASMRDYSQSPTARFLRVMIDKARSSEGYELALKEFNTDGDKHPRDETLNPGAPLGPMDREVANVIEHADRVIYSHVASEWGQIEDRHLLGALLVDDKGNTPRPVEARLRKIGINPRNLREAFYNFLSDRTQLQHYDNLSAWRAILVPWVPFAGPQERSERPPQKTPAQPKPPPEETNYTPGTAGYTSEFCGVGGKRLVVDHLNMEANANRLAELIALRETQLPLAIGLFGNWGSGKSHFMNLIDQHLKALAKGEKQTPSEQRKWYGEIVPVYFNAWHYLDANLWASLVSQIFESLFAHLRPKKDYLEVQKLLETASGAATRAAEEVDRARTATEKARNDFRTAQKMALETKTAQDGLIKGLSGLLPQLSPEELKRLVVEFLGVEKEVKTIDDLGQVVAESHTLSRRLWNAAMKQPGRNWRLGWLLGATILGPAVIALLGTLFNSQWPAFAANVKTLVAPLSVVLPVLTWVLRRATKARNALKELEKWQKKAEVAQVQKLETPEVKKAESEFTKAEDEEKQARARLVEAEAREKQLKEEAENLAPERRLGRYIEARAQSGDYRDKLGLVSLARRDFQELSDLFTNEDARNRKVQAVEKTEGKEAAKELTELSNSIDRIVLFVDDLDRCEPECVVNVLQAVHLLLAFPLFAVVVGVDQRCLRQSLRLQFKGLLTSEPEHKNGGANPKIRNDNADERPATPLDYLEKIFHVPFHLPPMEEPGFKTMIQRLTEPRKSDSSSDKTPPPETQLQQDSNSGPDANTKQKVDPVGPVTTSVPPVGSTQKMAAAPASAGSLDQNKPSSIPAPKTPPQRPTLGSVPLQQWERTALEAYHPLVTTPRAVARLLNTYRLVRAGIPQKEWEVFKGDTQKYGQFRIVMLLLAAAAGYPAVARDWFKFLRTLEDSSSLQNLNNSNTDPGWKKFQELYQKTLVGQTPNLTPEIFHTWLDRVEIFAF